MARYLAVALGDAGWTVRLAVALGLAAAAGTASWVAKDSEREIHHGCNPNPAVEAYL